MALGTISGSEKLTLKTPGPLCRHQSFAVDVVDEAECANSCERR
ncbi:MAG TPA: hypothetical protein PKC98_24985 [Candidatus Melainabacteria bacterium]|nr:hypothetical protein [Candidatus Melainabacteria bacterium]